MCIAIHSTFLPRDDLGASPAFDRDTLGFRVGDDVGYGGCAIPVGPSDQPDFPL